MYAARNIAVNTLQKKEMLLAIIVKYCSLTLFDICFGGTYVPLSSLGQDESGRY